MLTTKIELKRRLKWNWKHDKESCFKLKYKTETEGESLKLADNICFKYSVKPTIVMFTVKFYLKLRLKCLEHDEELLKLKLGSLYILK